MKNKILLTLKGWRIGIIVLMVVLMSIDGYSQSQAKLTRGKMWAEQVATNISDAIYDQTGYPGYFGSFAVNDVAWNRMEFWLGTLRGNAVVQASQPGETSESVIEPFTLVKNYNFSLDPNEPEEYISWKITSVDPTNPNNFDIEVSRKLMVWSLPKYDDFVIYHTTFTNVGTETIENFYWMTYYSIFVTGGGDDVMGGRDRFDDEFIWDASLRTFREEQGSFVFYDDTAEPPGQPPVTYNIPPGNTTGDRGDPGNIRVPNSIDRRLYSPQVFTDNIVSCTPNKNGVRNVFLSIGHTFLNQNPGAPDEKFYQPTLMEGYNYNFTRTVQQQPRMSWEETNAVDPTFHGSPWLRQPGNKLAIGPYDFAPGETVEFIKVGCWGEMDRAISENGGLEATQHYLEDGLADLRTNWEAAMSLIEAWEASGRTNWNAGITDYPPPTPGNDPMAGNSDELQVQLYVNSETLESGFTLTWTAVPDNYVDPIKGVNDFAGYRVYKSSNRLEGPWELAADISAAEAAGMTSGGKVTFTLIELPGIPFRFWVTSYDTDGNESGWTAYTFNTLAAKPAPTNDQSKVLVVPNPFRQVSGLPDVSEKRISFLNIPARCTIRIFNVAGELIRQIEHTDGFGEEPWGSEAVGDYQLTRFLQNVQPQVFIYHVTSHVSGHEGETSTGKFIVLK